MKMAFIWRTASCKRRAENPSALFSWTLPMAPFPGSRLLPFAYIPYTEYTSWYEIECTPIHSPNSSRRASRFSAPGRQADSGALPPHGRGTRGEELRRLRRHHPEERGLCPPIVDERGRRGSPAHRRQICEAPRARAARPARERSRSRSGMGLLRDFAISDRDGSGHAGADRISAHDQTHGLSRAGKMWRERRL